MVFKSFKVVTFDQVLGFDDLDSEGNMSNMYKYLSLVTAQTAAAVSSRDSRAASG